ncbi:hypothetical protein AAVH_28119 [Aphelenchoides avenae]|nr:hypothetical protein AAVH_28119 [Aphelenchus avenae]
MAYDNAPSTPPPSTSRYQETTMESSIRAMWRASTYLPYDREEILGHLARQAPLIGQPQPASLDDAIGVLWRARGGVSPFPYEALVQDFVASSGAPMMTQTAAAVAQRDLPLEAAIPLLRQASPLRPACRLGNDRRTSLPGPWAAAGPTGWASDYFGVRARRIERQGAIRTKAAKRLAAKKEAERRQAAKKLAARDARKQKRNKSSEKTP